MNNLAKERCVYNEVYIHDITSLCEKYLESHNRKPQTFYELMLNRQVLTHSLTYLLTHLTTYSLTQSSEKQVLVNLKQDKYIIESVEVTAVVVNDTPTPAVTLSASIPEENNEWLRNYINQDDLTENNTEDHAILQEHSDDDDDDSDDDSDDDDIASNYGHASGIRRLSITNNYISRYEQEFNELERLGKGASGTYSFTNHLLTHSPNHLLTHSVE